MIDKITPLPWKYKAKTRTRFDTFSGEKTETNEHWVNDSSDSFISIMGSIQAESDAKYIVHACNILPELIRMLETVESCHADGESFPIVELDELIKRAKGVL